MLKAVLFDMDGVIVDTEPLHYKAYKKCFQKVGIEVSSVMYEGFHRSIYTWNLFVPLQKF